MQLEKGSDTLRNLGNQLFQIVEELSGSRPKWLPKGGWYQADSPAGPYMYFRFVGERARKLPPESAMLNAKWDDRLASSQPERGNNWWGEPSADVIARAGSVEDFVRAEAFIRNVYQLVTTGDLPRHEASQDEFRLAEEVEPGMTYREGDVRRIEVNRFERDSKARRACIKAHGTKCCICEFSFGAEYGPEADGFIHVHHLRPLSEIGSTYEVNPVEDLRPVCPNCHAYLHLGGRCRSIDEVRQVRARFRQV
jgi:hypothetical protein